MTRLQKFAPVSALVLAASLGLAGAAAAQDADAPAAPVESNALALPDNPQFFTHNDPNHRKATVIINGEIITGTDVDQRVALIVAASGGKIGPEELQRLKLQVLRNLMDETLQIQEAKAQKVEIEESEVDQTYQRVASQNFGQNVSAMDAYLKRIGSSSASLRRQIRGELSWQRLLRRNVQPFVNVSDGEVRDVIKRLEASKGSSEFHVGEIFLSATTENEAAVLANANKIVDQLKQGASFVGYARQFSEASTAAVGGDLGWIRGGQLPTELDTAIEGAQPGQLMGPIRTRGGYSIMVLIDKRQVLTADPRDAVLSLKQIGMTFPAGIADAEAAAKAKAFAEAVKSAHGCAAVDPIAKQIGAEVVTNDQVKARDLPGPLQSVILGMSPGETTQPFGSIKEGVRILMLCGRDDPKASAAPDFEAVQQQLEDERVNKRAQTYLRDLRRDAIIDYD